MTDVVRAEDAHFHVDPDELAATRFLVRYKSPTREGYTLSLKQWFEFCDQMGVRPLQAERSHIEVWMRQQEVKGLMASTIAGKLNAIVGFYRLAHMDKVIVDDPTVHLRRPSVSKESRRQGMNRGETLRFLDAAKELGALEHALCCFLVLNGPRIGEAVKINCEDLGMEGGYRTLYLERAKGNRSAKVPLAPRTSMAFDHYLGSRTTGPVFLKPRVPKRMDGISANLVVKRVAKAAGITKTITPHSCRHTHITLALNAGVGTRDLVNSMGYADARQIARYDRDKDNLARSATHWVSAAVEGA